MPPVSGHLLDSGHCRPGEDIGIEAGDKLPDANPFDLALANAADLEPVPCRRPCALAITPEMLFSSYYRLLARAPTVAATVLIDDTPEMLA